MKKLFFCVFAFSFLCTNAQVVTGPGSTPTVTIGTQVWTSTNLNVPTYRNGDLIPEVTDATEWGNLTTGAWCWYNNDSATYAATYGRMYNWYAVNDPRGLAPTGYHIPTDGEWTMLSNYLGPDEAIKMKSTSGWAISSAINGNGTNTSGFSALPGASRYYYEDQQDWYFGYLFFSGSWWSADAVDDANAKSRRIQYFGNNSLISSNSTKAMGMHVRLIKDAITCTPNTGDTTATSCGSFEWYGNIYTTSGTPTHTFTNIGGCDSLVTLHLTINNINVSFAGDTLLFTIADCGESITDFHTSITNDILTITAANASNSIALASDIPSGITSNNASYVAVDLASIQNFSGIKIVGGSGTDIVTIGANGVDLSAIGYGNDNQSFTAILNSANDQLNVENAITSKGFGNIHLETQLGFSLNAPVTASLDSISLISDGYVYQTAPISSKYLSLGKGVRSEDICSSTDISNSGTYILTHASNAIDTLVACTNGSVSYNDLDNVVETFARISGNFTLTGGGNLKVANCGIVSTSAQSNINISSTGGSVAVENTGIRTNGDVTLYSATSTVSSDNFGIVSNGKITITASGNVSSIASGIDNNSGNGIDIKSINGAVNIDGNGIKSKDTIVINAYGNITICGGGVNNTAGTDKNLSIVSTSGTYYSNCSGLSSKGKITILTYGNVIAGGAGIQNGNGLGVDVTSTNGTVTVTDGGLTSNATVNLWAVGNVIARGVNAYNAGNINITSTGGSVSTGYGGVQTQGKITILSFGDIYTTDGGITNINGTGVDFTSTNGGIAVRAAGLSSKANVNFIAAGDIITTDGGMNLFGTGGKLTITSTSGSATISGGGTQTRGDVEIKAKRNVTISGGGLRNDNSANGTISLQSDSAAVVVSGYSTVIAKNNITVKANDLSLSTPNALKSQGKKIAIFPVSENTAIDLGGVSAKGVLGISNAFLDFMTADSIVIGDTVNTSSILASTKITDTVHKMIFVANPSGSITLSDSLRLKDVDISAMHTYRTSITSESSTNVLNVSGSVTLGSNAVLKLSTDLTGFATGNTIKLINNDNEDAVSGTFAGLNEGDTLSIVDGAFATLPLQISYIGGDGNDVVLKVFSLCSPNTGDTTAFACNSFSWYGTTYTASGTPTHTLTNTGGCDSLVTLHLTITQTPAQPSIGASGSTTICSGSSVMLTSSSSSNNQWYRDGVAITANGSGQNYTATISGSYTLKSVVNACESEISTATMVTVNPLSVSGTIAGAATVCSGTNSTVLTLSGNTGMIQWQSSTNNTSFAGISGATASTYTATNLTATTYYRAMVTSGICSAATTASAIVTVNPVITSGSYTGNGLDNRAFTGLGFSPSVVIVKAGSGSIPAHILTASMPAGLSKPMVGNNALVTDRIKSLTSDGFTIGKNNDVNQSGKVYYWTAISTSSEVYTGFYDGTGQNNRSISTVGFDPSLVIMLPADGTSATWRSSSFTGTGAATFSTEFNLPSTITALGAAGFTVGTDTRVNKLNTRYHYVAFKSGSKLLTTGKYTGNGVAGRVITTPGITVHSMFVKSEAGDKASIKMNSMPANNSTEFTGALDAGRIYNMGNGFTLGNQTQVNKTGVVYQYIVYGTCNTSLPQINLQKANLFVKEQPEGTTMAVFPNPAVNKATVSINYPANGQVVIELIDALGRKISSSKLILLSGQNYYGINTTGLRQGIYTVNLIGEKGSQTIKLVVGR